MAHSRKKKISIIGGGITGCAIAAHFKKKNYDVKIFEKKGYLGGILRDQESKNNFFLKGCQYLENNTSWIDSLKKNSNTKFINFDYNYASCNNFNNKSLFIKDLAIPVFEVKKFSKENFNIYKKKNPTLLDRTSFYPKKIKKDLLNFLENCNLDPKEIHSSCAHNLQISRLNFLNFDNELKVLKKSKKIFDDHLAISRKKNNFRKLTYSIPKNGYNELFDNILVYLKNIGVDVLLSKKVAPLWKGNRLTLGCGNDSVSDSLIFWSGNPTELIYNFNKKKLNSNLFKTFQISANIKSKYKKNFFLQNFSDKSKIFRIQTYTLSNQTKIGIECLFGKVLTEDLINEALYILKKFNIELEIIKSTITKTPITRFDIFTLSDQKIISEFQKKTKNTNLLFSPWLTYGRKNKIEEIISSLKKQGIY